MSFQNANVLIQTFVNKWGNTQRSYRAIDYVRDVSNANNTISLDSNSFLKGAGKKRSVRMNYFPILCGEEGDCNANICDTGNKVEPAQVMFDITECTATPIYAIDKDDIRLVDNNQWDFTGVALSIIASAMPNMREKLARAFVTKLYTMAGLHIDGTEERRIATTNSATGVVNPIGRFDIEREFSDGGFMRPYMLGGSEVYNWEKMVGIGGVNQYGQDISKLNVGNSYYDEGLSASILNDLVNGEHILAIDPQVFKFVTYAENAGIFRTGMADITDLPNLYRNNFAGFLEGSIIDPATGLLWDLYIRYDECTSQWNFQMKLRWDFFVLPEINCNVQGVNGIMHYRTCPPLEVQCPAGSPLTSPSGQSSFSWTPDLNEIPSAFTASIGGKNYQANAPVTITDIDDLVAFMNEAFSPSNPLFEADGSDVTYSGFAAISGTINGTVPIEFA